MSENTDFAQACIDDNGITFIGPNCTLRFN
ncbi:MAG: hypothetical protein U1F13_02935 [Acinetobacter parvus]